MDKVAVVTSSIDRRNLLREDQNATNATFIAFVGHPRRSSIWQERPIYKQFSVALRNQAAHKILIHQFVESDYSLWLDNNVSLRIPIHVLTNYWLDRHDIAVFASRRANCIADYASASAARRRDDPNSIMDQYLSYIRGGLSEAAEMVESCVVLRRHNMKIETFNNHWWSEYCRHSKLDELGFIYAATRLGLKINVVPHDDRNDAFFSFGDETSQPNLLSPEP
jgi:hypothetical protein